MNQSTTCKVCGQDLSVHHFVMRNGVAHAAVFVDGRSRSCSEIDADHHYTLGEIAILHTIIRSLRWRAGRLRTTESHWNADDLLIYSDKLQADRDRFVGFDVKYHEWVHK